MWPSLASCLARRSRWVSSRRLYLVVISVMSVNSSALFCYTSLRKFSNFWILFIFRSILSCWSCKAFNFSSAAAISSSFSMIFCQNTKRLKLTTETFEWGWLFEIVAYFSLILRGLQVLRLPRILLAEEGAKSDQVVLDEDILLSQLFLTDTAALLFPKSCSEIRNIYDEIWPRGNKNNGPVSCIILEARMTAQTVVCNNWQEDWLTRCLHTYFSNSFFWSSKAFCTSYMRRRFSSKRVAGLTLSSCRGGGSFIFLFSTILIEFSFSNLIII